MASPLDFAICSTCGIQYPTESIASCKICDDPRQYIPPGGQTWTSLRALQSSTTYTNTLTPDPSTPCLVSIQTTPKVGIGQRALLCRTPRGNILWDCLTYLDDATVSQLNALGGVQAIVISHPHYFATNLHWAAAFGCPVFLSSEDGEWAVRRGEGQVFWEGRVLDPLAGTGPEEDAGVLAIKTGGHFPGSSVLWWKSQRKLLVADSVLVVPSGIYHVDRPPGTASFTFMWSYPNMIPLPPDEVHNIWKAVKQADFDDAHGAFVGMDARGNAKQRMLASAQIFVRAMGYLDHPIHQEA
ncbi:metallo-beta-lactamase [Aspergillus sp. HF37]|nr:metallo-beta-lactamase [Aspergillus sp. HF37]